MQFEGKVLSVNIHESGGSVNIGGAPAMPGTPGNAHSANLSFPKAEAADWAALIGKTVVIEITEVVG